MQSKAATVMKYLEELPPDRRSILMEVRRMILENLPSGYQEVMGYGMICYVIPLSKYPKTYNGYPLSLASLASQKNHMSLYLMCIYGNKETEEWFKKEYAATGKKLNMGKSCIRFKKLEDLPLDLIGKTIARCPVESLIAAYEKAKKKA